MRSTDSVFLHIIYLGQKVFISIVSEVNSTYFQQESLMNVEESQVRQFVMIDLAGKVSAHRTTLAMPAASME